MSVTIVSKACVRCGACAVLCPAVFDITGPTSRVLRTPEERERSLIVAARAICPTDAIDADDDAPFLPLPAASFDELARNAERARWWLDDIAWDEVDAAAAPMELRAVVREMAFSENATYSATQRFLETFFEDVTFSQWMSVWFYEETRHPHVLMEWLRCVGEPLSSDFVVKGRVSTPFMRSAFGTLVTNVISEVTASQAYLRLARQSPEPVLADLATRIARDEARHAATFFRFARERLDATADEPARRDRARGLEVLLAWLGGPQGTTHPVAQMLDRLQDGAIDLGLLGIRRRVVRVIGLLLGLSLTTEADAAAALRRLLEGRTG